MIRTYSIHDAASAAIGPHTPKPTSITEGQTEAALTLWAHERIDTGIWECTPGSFTAERNGYTEICTILSGSVTLEVEGQQPERLQAGDVFVMPSGWKGVWHVHETLRKHYTTIDD